MVKLRSRVWWLGAYSILLPIVVAVSLIAGAQSSYAVSRPPYNAAESLALSQCAGQIGGAIWFTGVGASYYTMGVTVADGQTVVQVQINGSANGCGTSQRGEIYGTQVYPSNDPISRRLTIEGDTLDRGYLNGDGQWTTQGSSMTGWLNVAGLAMNNAQHDDTETINVYIHRMFHMNGNDGTAYADPVPVTVTRLKKAWSINGQSYISTRNDTNTRTQGTITAAVGDTLYWWHDLRNNGPSSLTSSLSVNIDAIGSSEDSGNEGFNAAHRVADNIGLNAGSNALFYTDYASNRGPYSLYTVTPNDVGHTICEGIAWSPENSSSAAWGHGYGGASDNGWKACATIPYHYTLTPSVQTSTTYATAGTPVTFDYAIHNNGTKTNNVAYQARELYIPAGTNLPDGFLTAKTGPDPQTNSYYDCSYYTRSAPGVRCNNISPNGTTSFAQNGSQSFTEQTTIGSFDGTPVKPGDRICRVFAVGPYNQDQVASQNRLSAVACVLVVQAPLVRVLGNDLRVGSSLTSIASNQSSNVIGTLTPIAASTSEYGILAPGYVKNMASQYWLPPSGDTSSRLTFANTAITNSLCSTSSLGCYTAANNMGVVPTNLSLLTSLKHNNVGITQDFGSRDIDQAALDQAVGGSTDAVSGVTILTTTGNVTISKNITYTTSPLATASDVPQLIIVGKTITIDADVTHVDAWLIATDTLKTCEVPAAQLTTSTCNQPLTVTGPIMAGTLDLYRTYYNAASPNDPAETFDMNPSAYIVSNTLSQENGTWQTMYATDLPPRY